MLRLNKIRNQKKQFIFFYKCKKGLILTYFFCLTLGNKDLCFVMGRGGGLKVSPLIIICEYIRNKIRRGTIFKENLKVEIERFVKIVKKKLP